MWTVLGTIGVVIATIVLGMLADKKWGLIPSPERLKAASEKKALPGHAPGEAPATALSVRPDKQRCPTCRAPMTLAGDEPVTYDGRTLRVLAFRCLRCEHTLSVYVDASAPA